ncbi:MAG: biopolymer transporter ExbD [Deltaproteobacteria bacterium]|jgi:biopolymer transport protein ExbD|nr:biopolymer transporter ExbD [Deltaproteobacteria bacterium]
MDNDLLLGADDLLPMSDINVTPFIDIMLVLLIIFMVTAPLMLGGVQVNLPKSSGENMSKPESPVIVTLDAHHRIYVDKEDITERNRHYYFQTLAKASTSGEAHVRVDIEVKYGEMMDLMAELGKAGFARVTLVTDVKPQSTSGTADQ